MSKSNDRSREVVFNEQVALNGIMGLRKSLTKRLSDRAEFRAKLAPLERRVVEPLRAIVERDPGAVEALKARAELLKTRRELLKGAKLPSQERPQIIRSPARPSALITRVPPYDLEWADPNTDQGNEQASASKQIGTFSSYAVTQDADQWYTAASGVGIFYRPSVDYVDVQIMAVSASYSFLWEVIIGEDLFSFGSSDSDASIYMAVLSYDLEGGSQQILSNQPTSLWSASVGYNFWGGWDANASDGVGISPLWVTLHGLTSSRWYVIWFYNNVSVVESDGDAVAQAEFSIPQVIIVEL